MVIFFFLEMVTLLGPFGRRNDKIFNYKEEGLMMALFDVVLARIGEWVLSS